MSIEEGARSLQVGSSGSDMALMASMMNNGGGFGGGQGGWMGMLLLIALLGGGRGLFGQGGNGFGAGVMAGESVAAGAGVSGLMGSFRDGFCCLQNTLNELSGKMLATQIALSDNVAQSTNSLTQNSNANFANTNGMIQTFTLGTARGFADASMERCAQTSKLATDINQSGAANIAATNNLAEKFMCGVNGLNTNLFNIASNLKDQATANFTILDKNDAAIGCAVEKLSVQSACETKDVINNDNNNTGKLLCAIAQTDDLVRRESDKIVCAIADTKNSILSQLAIDRKDAIILEQQERIHDLKEQRDRQERANIEINNTRQLQNVSDNIIASILSRLGGVGQSQLSLIK